MEQKYVELKIQAGPCIICGEKDYLLSVGGPTICPACDMGQDLKTRLTFYRERIKDLEAELEDIDPCRRCSAKTDIGCRAKERIKEIEIVMQRCVDAMKGSNCLEQQWLEQALIKDK